MFPGPPAARAAQAEVPVEIAGTCRKSGIGQALVGDARAEALPSPPCNLAVAIGRASLSFFTAGERTPAVLFSGSRPSASGASFRVELVRIADGPTREASSGQCLRMKWSIMCHAVFTDNGVRKGISLSFDLAGRPPLQRPQ